jgi:hypothetical protein
MDFPDPALEARRSANLHWEIYQALGDLYQRYQKYHVCKECGDICPATRAHELIKIVQGRGGE